MKESPSNASLPAWGEWVEINNLAGAVRPAERSLPSCGEWVEIASRMNQHKPRDVSPHMGRVG